MADLSKTEITALGRAAGLELEEPLLTEVAYNLNALMELIDEVNPAELDQVEPLPIIPPYEGSAYA
jgi:Asp-tRNA(Asn)/Glu-tRNA(Gln) amidotransferase C subunit